MAARLASRANIKGERRNACPLGRTARNAWLTLLRSLLIGCTAKLTCASQLESFVKAREVKLAAVVEL